MSIFTAGHEAYILFCFSFLWTVLFPEVKWLLLDLFISYHQVNSKLKSNSGLLLSPCYHFWCHQHTPCEQYPTQDVSISCTLWFSGGFGSTSISGSSVPSFKSLCTYCSTSLNVRPCCQGITTWELGHCPLKLGLKPWFAGYQELGPSLHLHKLNLTPTPWKCKDSYTYK